MFISRRRGFRKATLILCVMLWMGKSATAQKPMMAVEKNLPLSAEQTAQAIGLLPLFGQIKERSSNPSDQIKLVALEQQVLMQVTAASLQVHAMTGQIDSEIADTKDPYCAIAMADDLAATSETCRNILSATSRYRGSRSQG